jgi:hypothetical protein
VRPFDLSLKASPRFAFYLVSPRAAADRPLIKAFRDWMLREIRASGADPSDAA